LENCGNGVIPTVTTTRNISATNGQMGDLIAAFSALVFNEQVYYIEVPPELDLKERKISFWHSANPLCPSQRTLSVSAGLMHAVGFTYKPSIVMRR